MTPSVAAAQRSLEVEMPVPHAVQRASSQALKMAGALAFLAPLLTRVTLGWAFFLTGRGKLANIDTFVAFLTDLGVPFPALNAPFVAGLELVWGLCLIIGLLTRLMALGLAGTMVVALLQEKAFLTSWLPTGDVGPLDISPYVFLLFLSWLVLYGPGPVSLDKLLAKKLGLASAAEAGPGPFPAA